MPVYLRWRMGDAFEPGPWTLGKKYKWINPAAIIWVAICVIIFCLPFTPAGVPWRDEFDWKYVNYAPITVGGAAADRRRVVGWCAPSTRSRARCARSSSTTAPAVSEQCGRSSACARRSSGRAGACGTTRRCCCRAPTRPPSSAPAGSRSMLPPDPELATRARPRPARRADPGRRRRLRRDTRTATRSRSRWRLAALERDLPLLGVCRGMQLMNLARGGTLIEHLPDVRRPRGPPARRRARSATTTCGWPTARSPRARRAR